MIDAALAADGIARADWPRWEAGMNVLIGRESSWNPKIVNTWDSNAMAGHPSGGLTQTIASTYAGNRNPSLVNDMFDPVSNIAASINYIRRTYGDISQVQQANPNLPPKGYAMGGLITPSGYDKGGWLMPGGSGGVNGLSKPEAVLTPDESEAYVKQAKAAAAGGPGGSFTGTLVLDSGELLGVVRGQIKRLERESGFM
jgi:SLT domain-containing protein